MSTAQAPFGLVLDAVVGTVAATVDRKTTSWIDRLNAITDRHQSGGVVQQAVTEGVKARVQGKSATRAAVRGVWQGGSPEVRAAMVTSVVAAVLLLPLSPVLLVVYLLSWLVIAAVHRARPSRRHS